MWYLIQIDSIFRITRNVPENVGIYGKFETKAEAVNYFYDEVA
jgi:hypothetical protein